MAPTVLRVGNLRIVIYFRDHQPPHVHVIGPGQEAVFEIENLRCISSYGFSFQMLRRIQEYLKPRRSALVEFWNDYQE